jgi:Terminase small subunit
MKALEMSGPLKNPRWERFAVEYAAGETLEAAYKAGFTEAKGPARQHAHRLLQRPEVRSRVTELMEQYANQVGVGLAYLQQQMAQIIRVNPLDLFDASGNFKPITEISREVGYAIKNIKRDKTTGNVTEIQLADKIGAAGVLLRSIHGPDNMNNAVLVNIGDRLDAAIRRTMQNGKTIDMTSAMPPAKLEAGMEL